MVSNGMASRHAVRSGISNAIIQSFFKLAGASPTQKPSLETDSIWKPDRK